MGVRGYKPPVWERPKGLIGRLLCRWRGGHFPTYAFVDMGLSYVWSYVCERCGTYLGYSVSQPRDTSEPFMDIPPPAVPS